MKTISKKILKVFYKKRKKDSKKGDFGKLLIIGGSEKYSGAPALNALSALASLRSGVDVVEVAAPKRAADIIAKFSPNIITVPLDGNFFSLKHIRIILEESKNKNAFVIGAGLGKNPKTEKFVIEYLKNVEINGVIDAEAILFYEKYKNIDLSKFVFTPHSGEFTRLTKIKLPNNLEEKIKIVKEYAMKLNTTILLKGNTDIISNCEKTVVNKTGTPYMTKGGTGDCLAGILGSLIAQKPLLFEAACAAAFINGKAGELTKKKSSLLATDLIEKIGEIVDSV